MAKIRKGSTEQKNNVKIVVSRKRRRSSIIYSRQSSSNSIQIQKGHFLRNLQRCANKSLVVLISRCKIIENLIKNNNLSGNEKVADQKVTSISGVDKTMETIPQKRITRSSMNSGNTLQFIKSLQITTHRATKSRKIDVISLPVETTVSIKNENIQTEKRTKLRWKLRNDTNSRALQNLFRLTSSNAIFRNASLDTDSATLQSPTRILTRTFSAVSMNSVTYSDRWPTGISVTSEGSHYKSIGYNELPMSKSLRSPTEDEHDCHTKDSTLVRSESSGYHSEQKLNDISPISSAVSSPNRRISGGHQSDFIFPCGARENTSPVKTNLSLETLNKRKCDFKTPKLPALKRPPTRLKPIARASNVINNNIRVTLTANDPTRQVVEDDSDAISLYAESICMDFDDKLTTECSNVDTTKSSIFHRNTDLHFNDSDKTIRPVVDTTKHSSFHTSTTLNLGVKDKTIRPEVAITKRKASSIEHTIPKTTLTFNAEKRVTLVNPTIPVNDTNKMDKSEHSLRHPPLSQPLLKESPSTVLNTIAMGTNKVNNWIVSTPVTKMPVNINVFMSSLKKLCYIHYGKGKCHRDHCWYPHELPSDFQNTLRELDENQFDIVLKQILKLKYLFKETFSMILMYLKERGQMPKLIYLIEDILQLTFDKTPYIKQVILTLIDMGLTFVQAVEEVLLTYGRKKQILQDILLMLIVEEDDCLENNWHFIDKLTRFRVDKLDYGVVCEIFQKCCNTDNPSKSFCENIYKDLIIKNHIELNQINRSLVVNYINLLYHFNFIDYAEQLKRNNGIFDHEVTSRNARKFPVVNVRESPVANVRESPVANVRESPVANVRESPVAHVRESPVVNVDTSNVETESQCNNCVEYQQSSSSSSSTSSTSSSSSASKVEDVNEEQPEVEQSVGENTQSEVMKSSNVEPEGAVFFFNGSLADEDELAASTTESKSAEDQRYEEAMNKSEDQLVIDERYQHIQYDISYQNQNYNADLESYLNCVNRDAFSNNYYSTRTSTCSKRFSKGSDYNSPASEHSKSNHTFAGRTTDSNDGKAHSSSNSKQVKPGAELELCDNDIRRLVDAIKRQDMSTILSVMQKSAEQRMNRSFVIHTISALRNMAPLIASKIIVDMFENIESLPHLMSLTTRDIMQLLAFNTLLFLDQRKDYGTASRIISIFSKEMEAFMETECITNFNLLSTTKLRYIFVFKIYVRDRKLKEALKLFKSTNLHLFQDIHLETDPNLVTYKKRILQEFINVALQRELQVAREAILYMMLNMDSLRNIINVATFLNQLMVKMLNCYDAYRSEVLGLIDNITNGWFRYLKHSIMRALLVQSFYDLSDRKLMDFFSLCVDVGIYRLHEGVENSIEIPRNLLSEEIHLILHIHFHKICKSNFPLDSILISAQEQIQPDEYTHQIQIFTNSVMDNRDLVIRILNVFTKFEHFPTSDKMMFTPGCITIPYEFLQYFFIPYRTGIPTITKFR